MQVATHGPAATASVRPSGLASARAWYATLAAHRDLLLTLVQREIKVRYKQSVMGILWAILMPVLIVGAGLVVRIAMVKLSGGELEAYDLAMVTTKAVPWAFFVSSIRFATLSLISNSNLVTKIYTPREVFPFAAVLSHMFDFLVAATAIGLVLPFLGVEWRLSMLWIPALVLNLVLLSAGAGLFLSAASLFFRDVKYLVEVFVTFAIFFTPVFYEVTLFGDLATLLLLNPVAPILEGIGAAVVGGTMPALGWFAYSGAFALIGFLLALTAFKRMEPYFAESV